MTGMIYKEIKKYIKYNHSYHIFFVLVLIDRYSLFSKKEFNVFFFSHSVGSFMEFTLV